MADTFMVYHLPEQFRDGYRERFEIQWIGQFGQSLESVAFGDSEDVITLNGKVIPEAVVCAARALSVGQSRFVDSNGNDSYPGKSFNESTNAQDSKTVRRFFVLHLADEWPEKSDVAKYEIQIVNESGQALSWGYAGDHETEIFINGCRIPRAVLEAARRQLMGKGDYVDDNGSSISPVDL